MHGLPWQTAGSMVIRESEAAIFPSYLQTAIADAPNPHLNVANLKRLRQRCDRVAHRDELLRHEALEAGLDDCLRDCRVIEFLRVIDLVPAGVDDTQELNYTAISKAI